jgi:hypothetical protein
MLYRKMGGRSDRLGGIPLAALAVALLSLVLNASLYIFERNRQAVVLRFAAMDLEKRFSGSSFPINMAIAQRAEQTGLTRSSKLIGWIDAIVGESTKHTVIEGWVIDATYIDQSPVVLVFLNHEYVGSTVSSFARSDVVKELRLNEKWSSARVGFSLELPTSACPPAGPIEILIVSGNRYATIHNPLIKPNCSGVLQ